MLVLLLLKKMWSTFNSAKIIISPLLLEFAATIGAFDYRKIAPTFLSRKVHIYYEIVFLANFYLAQLLALTQLFERMPGETLRAGVQLGLLSTHDVENQLSCF